jgi:hypothetical protein
VGALTVRRDPRVDASPDHQRHDAILACDSVRECHWKPGVLHLLDGVEARSIGSGLGHVGLLQRTFRKGPTRHGGTPARREMTFKLTHMPTGITVEKHVVGPFTRKQAQETKVRLWDELFPLLEEKVGAHLRVPGR